MLNELMNLHHTLKELGCDLGVLIANFRSCPKGKAGFCVSLNEKGIVKDVTIPDFEMEKVFRWHEGKGNFASTFPVFNARALLGVPDPLPAFPEEKGKDILAFIEELKDPRKKTLKPLKEQLLEELEKKCIDLWDDKDIEWIGKCLKDTPSAISLRLGEIPKTYQSLEELIRRSAQCEPTELRKDIRSILKQKLIEKGERIYAEALFSVLKKGKKKRRGKEHGKDFLYLLTIDDWYNYPSDPNLEKYTPYDEEVQNWMKSRFEQFDKTHRAPTGEADAYGLDRSGSSENFKPVNVGGLGPTVPFTANDQIPCLERYGLEGSFLFPVGEEAREMAGKSMAYILDPAREGTTWKGITKYETGHKKKKKRNTVVFAYCTELKDANALQFFDREDDDVNHNIYRSEAATKLALAAFDGIVQQRPDAKIVVNILAAVDPGNKKVLANRQYKVSDLSDGASQWQTGCANILNVDLPRLTIKAKKDGDKKINISGAIPIYPLEAIKLLNSDWQQDGTMVTLSKRFGSDEALDFLFEKDEAVSQRIDAGLSMLVAKSCRALVPAKLKACHDHYDTKRKLKFKDSTWLHMLPSLYGLLLYKKGIKKEDYMKEDMFYLGRYFALVDTIYIQYHKDVRSGKVPMSLLGNDHMSLALLNPVEAFLTLSRRLAHPYISWAKRVGTDKEPGRIAKSCLRKIADLTEELSKTRLPTEIDDADRAKLLLGYLSYGAKKDQTPKKGDEPDKNEKGEEL